MQAGSSAVGTRASRHQQSSRVSWFVAEGDGKVEREGCMASPNFLAVYNDEDACTITVEPNRTGTLDMRVFYSEFDADFLLANNRSISGWDGDASSFSSGCGAFGKHRLDHGRARGLTTWDGSLVAILRRRSPLSLGTARCLRAGTPANHATHSSSKYLSGF